MISLLLYNGHVDNLTRDADSEDFQLPDCTSCLNGYWFEQEINWGKVQILLLPILLLCTQRSHTFKLPAPWYSHACKPLYDTASLCQGRFASASATAQFNIATTSVQGQLEPIHNTVAMVHHRELNLAQMYT